MAKVGRGGRSKSVASQNHKSENDSDHVSEVMTMMRGSGGHGKRESHVSSHVSQMEAIEEHAKAGGKGTVSMTAPISRASLDGHSIGRGREACVSTSIYGNEDATADLMEKVKQLNNHPKP